LNFYFISSEITLGVVDERTLAHSMLQALKAERKKLLKAKGTMSVKEYDTRADELGKRIFEAKEKSKMEVKNEHRF
jgi:hypothetical protein